MKYAVVLVFLSLQALAGDCADNVKKLIPPTKENVTPGAILVVKNEWYIQNDTQTDGRELSPGDRLKVLRGPWNRQGAQVTRLELADGFIAEGFWIHVKKNTRLETAGQPYTKVKKSVPPKLELLYGSEVQKDKTIAGRPFAKVGDMVWITTPGNLMQKANVGRVQSIRLGPIQSGMPLAVVLTEKKTLREEDLNQVHPLTMEEIALYYSYWK